MKLEDRYFVVKRKDLMGLPVELRQPLSQIISHVQDARTRRGAGALDCLCIERDWPEYQPVLAMLSKRVDGVATVRAPPLILTHSQVLVLQKQFEEENGIAPIREGEGYKDAMVNECFTGWRAHAELLDVVQAVIPRWQDEADLMPEFSSYKHMQAEIDALRTLVQV